MSSFNVGDRVVFVHDRYPRYTGTVVAVRENGGRQSVSVRYDTYKPELICHPLTQFLRLLESATSDISKEWFS